MAAIRGIARSLTIVPTWLTKSVSLEGWDNIPRGYGAKFDLRGAPWWLRVWFKTPFIDALHIHSSFVADTAT